MLTAFLLAVTVAGITQSASGDGLPPGVRDRSPYPEGMSRILRYLGHADADYIDIMAQSGMAFVVQVDLDGPRIDGAHDLGWWPNDAWPFALRTSFLSDVYGRTVVYRNIGPTEESRRVSPQLLELLRPSLSAGRPAMGESDAAMIITGLDGDRARSEWASPGQPVFNSENPHAPWGVFVFGDRKTPISRHKADVETLRWAIALGDDKASRKPNKLTGQKAWKAWDALLADPSGAGARSWDLNMIWHLKYQRSAAITWLGRLADRTSGDAANSLRQAADRYRQVLGVLEAIPLWSPDAPISGRAQYAADLRKIAKLESEAMQDLRVALAAMER